MTPLAKKLSREEDERQWAAECEILLYFASVEQLRNRTKTSTEVNNIGNLSVVE